MIEAYLSGDVMTALELHRQLLPIYTGIFATQGCISVKGYLDLRGARGRRPAPASRRRDGRRTYGACRVFGRRRSLDRPGTPRHGSALSV